MCIIIGLPSKNEILNEIEEVILETSWDSNEDGGGFSYVENVNTENARVKIIKGFFKFESFYNRFIERRNENPDSRFLIHFRYKTKGKIDVKNCHPFYVFANELSMAHNGTIHKMPADSALSDSYQFAKFLKDIPPDFITNSSARLLIENYIGKSKVVLLDKNNNLTIYNESEGIWKEDVWFSNRYFSVSRVGYISKREKAKREKEKNKFKLFNTNHYSYEQYENDYWDDIYGNINTSKLQLPYKNNEQSLKFCSVCKTTRLKFKSEKEARTCFDCMDEDRWKISDDSATQHIDTENCIVCGVELLPNIKEEQDNGFCSRCLTSYGIQYCNKQLELRSM